MLRRVLFAGVLSAAAIAVPLLAPAGAQAASEAKFTEAAFAAAQAAGKPILVEVHADWCPTCAKQKPILGKLGADPANKELVRLVVDFDAQKDVLRALKVQTQSTLIAYRGAQEKDRSVGVTDEALIKALVAKTRG